MMGSNDKSQDEFFYSFNLEDVVPEDHLLRSIDRFLDLSDLREHLAPYYSQLGHGADTIVVFGVLFIDSMPSADILTILTLAAMGVVFVFVGIYAVRHPSLCEWIDRYAYRVMPFVLIIVGVYIVANTATDLLPG